MNDNEILDTIEHITAVIQGGEYRYRLPGRGIAKVVHYQPFVTVFSDAVTSVADTLKLMADTMSKIDWEALTKNHATK